jgi:hypothetical protein
LVIVTDNEHVIRQLHGTGAIEAIGSDNVHRGTEFIDETVRRAHDDAVDRLCRGLDVVLRES